MRLVHLADYGGPYAGSFVYMLRSVLSSARTRRWEVEVVFGPAAEGRPWLSVLRDADIPVSFAPPRPRGAARSSFERMFANAAEPTIVHTHFTGFDIPAAQVVGRRPEAALVWHNHMGPSGAPRTVARNVLKYLVYGSRIDQMLCVAPDAVDTAKRRGAPRKRTRFWPNAIETSRFPLVTDEERSAARAALGVSASVPLLLHFGWDWHRKGGDVLLAAAREMRQVGLPVVVATVGGGERARALAGELGVDEAVLTLDPREDVRGLLAAADVFVSCSRAEGTTYSVAEALCCGVPVVASRIPGQEWIAPQEPARRLIELDSTELSGAVRGLLDRPTAVAAAERSSARAWVLEHMGLDGYSERLLDLYEEIHPGLSGPRSVRSDSARSAR